MRYCTKKITIPEFNVQIGKTLKGLEACYTLYGDLSNNKKTALFFHGFSSNSELHTWWCKFHFANLLSTYNILCVNSLGSSHGTTGPESVDPLTNKQYLHNYPSISIEDMVNFTAIVLTNLGLDQVDLVFGCSLGGMQVIDMYLRYPNISSKFVSVAGVPVPYMTKLMNLAQARLIDVARQKGRKTMLRAMGLSRSFFRLVCTTEEALDELKYKMRISNQKTSIQVLDEYFENDNMKYQNLFSPYSNSLYLKVMSNFELDDEVMERRGRVTSSPLLHLVSISNDGFTPMQSVLDVYRQLKQTRHYVKHSTFVTKYGHEAWIIDGGKFYEFAEKNSLF